MAGIVIRGGRAGIGVGTPAISVVSADSSGLGPLNLTTEGTLDWLVPRSNNERSSLYTAASYHTKLSGGGWLARGFEWVFGGLSLSQITAATPPTLTTTDPTSNSKLTADNGARPYIRASNLAHVNYGFRFAVPAAPTQRVLRLYSGQSSCNLTVAAHLLDESGVTQSVAFNTAAGVSAQRRWTITYTARQLSELLVTMLATTTHQVDASVGLVAATLSTV